MARPDARLASGLLPLSGCLGCEEATRVRQKMRTLCERAALCTFLQIPAFDKKNSNQQQQDSSPDRGKELCVNQSS